MAVLSTRLGFGSLLTVRQTLSFLNRNLGASNMLDISSIMQASKACIVKNQRLNGVSLSNIFPKSTNMARSQFRPLRDTPLQL